MRLLSSLQAKIFGDFAYKCLIFIVEMLLLALVIPLWAFYLKKYNVFLT